jgi:ABC-2 type transport system permease protein
MNPLRRVGVIIGYELRRAVAKKWILALIVLAITFETLYIVLQTRLPAIFIAEDVMWVFGVLSGQSMFIQLIAILIAGSSMSEEYERGTADILLSKPITKIEYMAGKFLGGFSLLVLVEAIVAITGVALAVGFFGSQRDLHVFPGLFISIVYASVLFFSLTFMFSELLRRSTMAMLTAFGIFIVSSVVGSSLSYLYAVTNELLYLDVSRLLPTWSAVSLPTFLAAEYITIPGDQPQIMPSGDIQLAAVIVAVYTIVFVVITTFRLVRSDVTKKAE